MGSIVLQMVSISVNSAVLKSLCVKSVQESSYLQCSLISFFFKKRLNIQPSIYPQIGIEVLHFLATSALPVWMKWQFSQALRCKGRRRTWCMQAHLTGPDLLRANTLTEPALCLPLNSSLVPYNSMNKTLKSLHFCHGKGKNRKNGL